MKHDETRPDVSCGPRGETRKTPVKQGKTAGPVSGGAAQGTGETNGTPPLRGGVFRVVSPCVPDLPDRLDALARHVGRLSPSHREPERYHEEKSEIAFELRVLARHVSTR